MKYLKKFNEGILNDIRKQTNDKLADIHSKLSIDKSSGKFCHECGVELELKSNFCGECGSKQDSPETTIVINNITILKDGGSMNIESNKGNFIVDRKIGTKTPYKITKPSRIKGNTNAIALDTEVDYLINSLKEYMNQTNQKYIKDYIDGIEDNRVNYSYPDIKQN